MTGAGFKSLIVLILVASGVLAFWTFAIEPHIPDLAWSQRIQDGILSLPAKRPPDIPLGEWDLMVGWTMNLHANCGDSRVWVSRDQRYAFLEAFERRLQEPVDATTIDWIWDEYARNSKWGPSYSDRYRPTRSPDLKLAQPGCFMFPVK